jgi:flagellar basal body-associated protein FliL
LGLDQLFEPALISKTSATQEALANVIVSHSPITSDQLIVGVQAEKTFDVLGTSHGKEALEHELTFRPD